MLRLLALLMLVALVGGGYYYWRANPGVPASKSLDAVAGQLKDTALTGAVRTALQLHGSLRPYAIVVGTEGGVVTLRGTLPQPELRAAAERVAAAVPDVRQVVNHLQVDGSAVQPPAGDERSLGERLDDETLEVQVRMAFSLNKKLRDAPIQVDSHRKELRLSGSASSEELRREALRVAGDVAGVKAVTDTLRVGVEAVGADVRDAVRRALRSNANLSGAEIEVANQGARLVLRGRVRTGAERELAGLLARDAAGREVDNRLQVRP